MKKLILHPDYNLYERKGKPFCSSLQVAEEFGKEHKNVLRDIENLDCSEEFNELNFERVKYKDGKGEKRPMYLMTKDGFIFLVMGYRGKKAAKFKEAYIKRFNEMEAFISSLISAKIEHPAFTRAIMDSHEEPKHYHFSNEADMINMIVLGMKAKQFRELHGLVKGQSIRPYLTTHEIAAIEALQRADIGLLMVPELDFQARKKRLTEYHGRLIYLPSGIAS